MAESESIQNVLVVVAHPDDCDFGCAATTALWTSQGIDVSYCIATDGDAGGSDPHLPGRGRLLLTTQPAHVGP